MRPAFSGTLPIRKPRCSPPTTQKSGAGYLDHGALLVREDEAPTEFVKVAVTVPSALVSPLYVNGTVSTNVPPPAAPFALEKYVCAVLLNETGAGVEPLRSVPEAALNLNVACSRSRGVE